MTFAPNQKTDEVMDNYKIENRHKNQKLIHQCIKAIMVSGTTFLLTDEFTVNSI